MILLVYSRLFQYLLLNVKLPMYLVLFSELPPTKPQNLKEIIEHTSVISNLTCLSLTTQMLSSPWFPTGLKESEHQCNILFFDEPHQLREEALNPFGTSRAENRMKFVRGNVEF